VLLASPSGSRRQHRQLPNHLNLAKQNGLTEAELIEVITHLAFYAGWPKAMSAMNVAKTTFPP
jgi:4-carboxymuconolactone decarboxylase